MDKPDRKKPSTLQHQLYKTLKEWFVKDFSPEETLPTEINIANKFDVSRGTVRTALDLLVKEELITRISGRGSFLNPQFYIKLKKYNIGVILSDIDFFSNSIWEYNWFTQLEIINGIMSHNLDYNISSELISEKHFSDEDNDKYDGYIIWPFVKKEIIKSLKKPQIALLNKIDMVQGFSLIAHEMVKKAYNKPAYIGFTGGTRVKTINKVLKKGGVPLISDDAVYECGGSAKEAYRSCIQLMEDQCGVDSIVCSTDYRAEGVIQYLNEIGVQVPDQVAVYGFEGTEKNPLLGTSISTCSFDGTYPGLFAVQSIRALLDGQKPPEYHPPKCVFVEKQST